VSHCRGTSIPSEKLHGLFFYGEYRWLERWDAVTRKYSIINSKEKFKKSIITLLWFLNLPYLLQPNVTICFLLRGSLTACMRISINGSRPSYTKSTMYGQERYIISTMYSETSPDEHFQIANDSFWEQTKHSE